jgi:hypothetical protein
MGAPKASDATSSATSPAEDAAIATGHGSAGKILRGALLGVLKGAGTAVKDVALSTHIGQELQENKIARAGQIQEQQLKAQAAQQQSTAAKDIHQQKGDEHQKAQDEHNDWLIDHNSKAMAQVHTAFENHTAEDKQVKDIADTNAKFITDLRAMGVHPEDVKTFDNLNQQHAQGMTNGSLTPVAGPDTGANAGMHMYNTNDLRGVLSTQPLTIKSDYQIDPKTGELKATKTSTLPVGTDLYQAWLANATEIQKGQTLLSQFNQKQAAQEQAEKVAKDQAEAYKFHAEGNAQQASAELTKRQAGGSLADPAHPDQPAPEVAQFLATLPQQVQDSMKKYNGQTQGMFVKAAVGDIDPSIFTNNPRKGGMGMSSVEANGVLSALNPNYQSDLYKTIQAADKDMITGKGGQAVRSFNQFLVHGDELRKVSSDFQRTGSPVLNTPLNEISNKFQGNPQVPELMTAIQAARTEWQTFVDSGFAPKEATSKYTETLMNDASTPSQILGVLGVMGTQAVGRLDQINESYKSASHGRDWPNLITPSGREAANNLGLGDQISKYKTGGYLGGATPAANPAVPKNGAAAASAAGGQAVSIGGQSYNKNADGSVTVGGHDYVPSGNGQWALRQPKVQSPVAGRK